MSFRQGPQGGFAFNCNLEVVTPPGAAFDPLVDQRNGMG